MADFQLKTTSPDATERVGERLASYLIPGDCIPLIGEMGSGKTRFVNGVARGLEVQSPVSSPTFTLINRYSGKIPLFHIDLYRLSKEGELDDLGLDEILTGNGVTLIEWPELAECTLPKIPLRIRFKWEMKDEGTRILSFYKAESRFDAFFKELVRANPRD